MKVLEIETKESKVELDILKNQQELNGLNKQQAHTYFLWQHCLWLKKQEQEKEEWQRQVEKCSHLAQAGSPDHLPIILDEVQRQRGSQRASLLKTRVRAFVPRKENDTTQEPEGCG
ncbi:hypothetical protein H920_12599 [Fukomys damarensis]|uniref:Uncharacterized protein n=1 Tax=Fukomys damarensis TaxID=885580 RepID=A0A091D6B5_FUKDA|nr:hypothetical protein H920_12599 [Fukomys damarensis]